MNVGDEKPTTRLVAAEHEAVNGRDLIRLDLVTRFARPKGKAVEDLPGHIWLDPERHWAKVKSESIGPSYGGVDAVNTWTVAYRDDCPDFPMPAHVVDESRTPAGKLQERTTYDLDRPQPCHLAASEFALERYGLAVPGSVRRTNWFLVVNAAVLLLLGVGYAVYARRRRSRRAVADGSQGPGPAAG